MTLLFRFLSSRSGIYVVLILFVASAGVAEHPFDNQYSPGARPVPAFCFAPGASPEAIAEAYSKMASSYARMSLDQIGTKFEFVDGDRWMYTATSGGPLSQGDPMVLTWSVIPDGTYIAGYAGEPASNSNLRSFLNSIYGSESAWLAVFEQVFDRWSDLSGITYLYEPNDDGASFPDYRGGQVGVRGDIRIGGHYIDGTPPPGTAHTLAYNFFPDYGDMVIDTGDSAFEDTSSNSLLLRNTVAHEHGHGLGLHHSCPMNQTKLMEPMLSDSFDGPQHDDVLAVNRGYGDRFEHDENPATAASLGNVGQQTLSDLSIDDNSDTDVFSFSAGSGATLDISVVPVGSTYLSGPQVGKSCSAGSSFNSLAIHDLALRVLDVNGVSQLASIDENGAGQSEETSGVQLTSGAGTYFVEITGDSSNEAQMYELELTVSPSDAIFSDDFDDGHTGNWSSTVPPP